MLHWLQHRCVCHFAKALQELVDYPFLHIEHDGLGISRHRVHFCVVNVQYIGRRLGLLE